MAHYAYKNVVHDWPDGLQERWEAAEGREYDGNVNYDGDAWLVTSMWIDEMKEEITRLRAELAEARAERDAAIRERDEARERYYSALRSYEEACRQRDERPAISREDAALFVASDYPLMDNATSIRVFHALRAHAASATKGGDNG